VEEESTETNADIVRAMYGAYNSRDRTTALAHMDSEVIWDFTEAPDGLLYRGHGEVKRFFAMLDEVWETLQIEVEAQEEHGDVVVSEVRVKGRGKGSGVEVQHSETHVWRLHEGRLLEGKTFLDRAQALAAVS
jgi:ketosteroid isomerase-like protein